MAHQTPISVRLSGNDNLCYVVAFKATEIVTGNAQAAGLTMAGADATWWTGMLSVHFDGLAGVGSDRLCDAGIGVGLRFTFYRLAHHVI